MVYSSYAALAGGNHVGILIKSAPREKMIPYILPVHTEDIYWLRSDSETTSIRNQFLDDKHERRSTTALAQGSTITVAELPEGISAKIYQLAGLMKGDYEDDIIKVLAQRGKVALDMQGYLRVPDPSTKEMVYHDWDRKQEYFPHITYLKTDAAEAEILTGTSDRREAARLMVEWGVKEALITHNTEVLVYDGQGVLHLPPETSGAGRRTGRGDTTFSAYITERERADIPRPWPTPPAGVAGRCRHRGPLRATGRMWRRSQTSIITEGVPWKRFLTSCVSSSATRSLRRGSAGSWPASPPSTHRRLTTLFPSHRRRKDTAGHGAQYGAGAFPCGNGGFPSGMPSGPGYGHHLQQ